MRTYEDDECLDGYRLLAQLIVTQAADDYRNLRRNEHKRRIGESEQKTHKSQVEHLENFFVSAYGEMLCCGNGKEILDRLRKEFE